MIVFTNPGLIHEDLVTTLGVNVKEGSNPIGQFGTGLKYAIAVVLRLGGSITIHKGLRALEFTSRRKVVRGKEFYFIHMNGNQLGFTDQLGAHWEPWMAFREFWSNMRDEGGECFSTYSGRTASPQRNVTTICIECKEMERAYETRHETLILTQPIDTLRGVEVHPGLSKYVFYRGIRAMELPRQSLFTYNITESQTLTEDRTIAYTFQVPHVVLRSLLTSTNNSVLERVLSEKSTAEFWEHELPYSSMKEQTPSTEFLLMCDHLKAKKDLLGRASQLFNDMRDRLPGYVSPYIVHPTQLEKKLLDDALDMVRKAVPGALEGVEILFKSTLNATYGFEWSARDNSVVTLRYSSFEQGLHALARVLLAAEVGRHKGSLAEQLLNFVLTGSFIPDELVKQRLTSDLDMPF